MHVTIKYDRIRRKIALSCFFVFLMNLFDPSDNYAGSGPSQPEVQGFTQAGNDEMVDPFTGDFNYNIPLFELPGLNGGYPFNLSYSSGITMDQEASWVGLGWALNVGALTRNMRGLPDEFDGDKIETITDLKDNYTRGASFGGNVEFFGNDGKGPVKTGIGLSFTVYNNSYKGVGYSIEPSFGLSAGEDATFGLNFDFKFDSQSGVDFSPRISISSTLKEKSMASEGLSGSGSLGGSLGISLPYNSREGLKDVNLDIGLSYQIKNKDVTSKVDWGSIGCNAYLGFINDGSVPSVSMPFHGTGGNYTIKVGGAFSGVYGNGTITGFHNKQMLAFKGIPQRTNSYGYLHLQDDASKSSLLDYNREKDMLVTKKSTNLPIPVLTYDIYTVSGQGIGTMFRPHRTDIGILYDNQVSSDSYNWGIGGDVGIPAHGGLNAKVSWSLNKTGLWEDRNGLLDTYNFKNQNDATQEVTYFKSHGEYTTEPQSAITSIGGEDPISIKVKKVGTDKAKNEQHGEGLAEFVNNKGQTVAVDYQRSIRQPRTNNIIAVKNSDVLCTTYSGEPGGVGTYTTTISTAFNEFKDSIFDIEGDKINFDRTSRPGHHFAGFIATNSEGMRYNYTIPAYNNVHHEVAFSTDQPMDGCVQTVDIQNNLGNPQYHYPNTDEYYKKTSIPPYAHSYLLTSVLGTDYIDLGSDGITDDDLGYWVKFEYVEANDTFKWRAPFKGANFITNHESSAKDNMATYMYGEKELWYLARAETKTHVAIFITSERLDGRGVNSELQDVDQSSYIDVLSLMYKLDTIKLYSKNVLNSDGSIPETAVPIKTIVFSYSYSLCKGIPNTIGVDENTGKLTLDSIYFTYGSNTKGSLTPYRFSYHDGVTTGKNPDYNTYENDRWSNYKPLVDEGDYCQNVYFPYVDQYGNKDSLDKNAAAWDLYKIKMPSGGEVEVKYEADDYGYVQDKVAMQMFNITSLSTTPETNTIPSGLDGEDRRIYFNLETPVSTDSSDNYIKQTYLDSTDQLYYKIRVHIKANAAEYIAGYADIEGSGFDHSEGTIVEDKFTLGYVQLAKPKSDGNTLDYHPFSVAAWQYLRTNMPDLLYGEEDGLPASLNSWPVSDNKEDNKNNTGKFRGVREDLAIIFKGYYNHAQQSGWGDNIDLSKSWIRLNSPDLIKYGGGVRVDTLIIRDGWDEMTGEPGAEYGKTYDYTKIENGKRISSGVACYEPIIGGDEIALRAAQKYTLSTPLKTNKDLFVEYPVNESYFPSPSVGYSKVTVKSLGSDTALHANGTGATVYDFYTSRDFPVIYNNTSLKNDETKFPFNLYIPIPGIGNFTVNNLTASQGYSIITNDMNGKQFKVSNYAQDAHGNLADEPYNYVQYNYNYKEILRKDPVFGTYRKYKVLDNVFPVIQNDTTKLAEIGVDYDLFTDMKESSLKSGYGGINLNVDGLGLCPSIFCIPLPFPWPNISTSRKILRTAVTNKIVNHSGIMSSTESFDEGSYVKTENLKFDYLTGQPVLSTVTNEHDKPVYNYNIPAFWHYDQMGASYRNSGIEFDIYNDTTPNTEPLTFLSDNFTYPVSYIPENIYNQLTDGDEFVVTRPGTNLSFKCVLTSKNIDDNATFAFYDPLTPVSGSYHLKLVRSGRRNMLTSNAGNIVAIDDPTIIQGGDSIKRLRPDNLDRFKDELISWLNSKIKTNQDTSTKNGTLDTSKTYFTPDLCEKPIKYPILSTIFTSAKLLMTKCDGEDQSDDAGSLVCGGIQFYANCENYLIPPCGLYSGPSDVLPLGGPIPTFVTIPLDLNCNGNNVDEFNFLGFAQHSEEVHGYRIQFKMVDKYGGHNVGMAYIPFLPESKLNHTGDCNIYDSSGCSSCELENINTRIVKFEPGPVDQIKIVYSNSDTIFYRYMSIDPDHLFTPLKDTFQYVTKVLNGSAVTYSENNGLRTGYFKDNFPFTPGLIECDMYSSGYKGVWRPEKNFIYRDERSSLDDTETTPAEKGIILDKKDGSGHYTYKFYLYNYDTKFNVPKWIDATTNTAYDPNSNNVESFDAIGNYSASKYGYNSDLMTCKAVNSKFNELFYTGFEDTCSTSYFDNFIMYSSTEVPIVTTTKHTGKRSMVVTSSGDFSNNMFPNVVLSDTSIISLWVNAYDDSYDNYNGNYSRGECGIFILYRDANGSVIKFGNLIKPSGPVIEKWQRLEAKIDTSLGAASIQIVFVPLTNPESTIINTFFDDIRIYPSDAIMESYVYDPKNYRLKAVLDNNNFFSNYGYDDEGNLYVIEKETEKGIKTIQESRSNIKRP